MCVPILPSLSNGWILAFSKADEWLRKKPEFFFVVVALFVAFFEAFRRVAFGALLFTILGVAVDAAANLVTILTTKRDMAEVEDEAAQAGESASTPSLSHPLVLSTDFPVFWSSVASYGIFVRYLPGIIGHPIDDGL